MRVRRWGRIGTRRARTIKLVLVDAKAARWQVAEVRVPAVGAEAA